MYIAPRSVNVNVRNDRAGEGSVSRSVPLCPSLSLTLSLSFHDDDDDDASEGSWTLGLRSCGSNDTLTPDAL